MGALKRLLCYKATCIIAVVNVETAQTKTPDRLFIVYLRDGRTFPVTAASFARRINPDDLIKFITSDGAELEDIFLRAPDTSAIAPDAPSVIPLPLVTLQNDVDMLKIRM